MQAVIICGGKGLRLKSLIGNKPKALVKFQNKENLKNQINILKASGVKDFLFLVNNYEEEIRNFLKKNYKDKFIIRSYSPVITIGGGEVMEVLIEEKWKVIKEKLQNLYDIPKSNQLIQLVEYEGVKPITLDKLQYRLGISKEQIDSLVEAREELFWLSHKQGKWLITHNQWDTLKNSITDYILMEATPGIEPG